MKILIVDDNPLTAKIVGELLIKCGVADSDVSFVLSGDIAAIYEALGFVTPEVLFVKINARVPALESSSWCMEHVLDWFTLNCVPMPLTCCMFLTADADGRLLRGRAGGGVTHFMNPTNHNVRHEQVLSFIHFCQENMQITA